jgi:hypothetical protein
MPDIDIAMESTSQQILAAVNGEHGSIEYDEAGEYTWICPQGISQVFVTAAGGGGGGGGGGASAALYGYGTHSGGGGGAGATPSVITCIIPVVAGEEYRIDIGGGGAGGAGGTGVDYDVVNSEADGKSGQKGGNTRIRAEDLSALLTASGSNGGGGGKGPTRENDALRTGGIGGTVVRSRTNNIFLNAFDGADGSSGSDGVQGNNKDGGAGGSYNNLSFMNINVYGGNGGAGGKSPSDSTGDGLSGSAGSKGKDGYLLMVW